MRKMVPLESMRSVLYLPFGEAIDVMVNWLDKYKDAYDPLQLIDTPRDGMAMVELWGLPRRDPASHQEPLSDSASEDTPESLVVNCDPSLAELCEWEVHTPVALYQRYAENHERAIEQEYRLS